MEGHWCRASWQGLIRKHVAVELTLALDELGLDTELGFCKSLVRWVGHIWRHPKSIVTLFVQLQNDACLQHLRNQDLSNRPRTRAEPGSVFRWAEFWVDSIGTTFSENLDAEVPSAI